MRLAVPVLTTRMAYLSRALTAQPRAISSTAPNSRSSRLSGARDSLPVTSPGWLTVTWGKGRRGLELEGVADSQPWDMFRDERLQLLQALAFVIVAVPHVPHPVLRSLALLQFRA